MQAQNYLEKGIKYSTQTTDVFPQYKNVPTLINVTKASRSTGNQEGLRVYAMHLIELSERSSAILMVHKIRKNGMPFWNRGRDSDPTQIVVAFEAFRHLSQVSVRPTTAISAMSTMHEDISNSAAKNVAMIILPFHKHQKLDGSLETTRAEFRHVNKRVLKHAPRSVGILVDPGFGGAPHVAARNVDYTITAFFFGGHDDREALSYGALMAKHPSISLNVVRFTVNPDIVGESIQLDMDDQHGAEARPDDEAFLAELKQKNVERYNRSNLVLVGRMPEGQLVAALGMTNECPELGPVGNLLTSPEFSTSVLVVQQYHSQLSGDSLNSLIAEDTAEQTSGSQ